MSHAVSSVNSGDIRRASLDDSLFAFQSAANLLRGEAEKDALDWPQLVQIGRTACSQSQRIHLMVCAARRRAEMPCRVAGSMFRDFLDTARGILEREARPPSFDRFQVYVDRIKDRLSDLSKLDEIATRRDKYLGFEVLERARIPSH
jgi:hypothetical protein